MGKRGSNSRKLSPKNVVDSVLTQSPIFPQVPESLVYVYFLSCIIERHFLKKSYLHSLWVEKFDIILVQVS